MKQEADLIITHASIYVTGDSLSANSAMAIKKGKILAIGPVDSILKRFSAPLVKDISGSYIYPGFIDAHCHFYGLAQSLRWIDLNGCRSFDEVLSRIIAGAGNTHGEWIVGRGWDHNLWPGKRFPDRVKLDSLFPSRPVALLRIDGHVLLANTRALELAGIGVKNSYSPQEVEVINGRLTGILGENAADHVRSIIPAPKGKELAALLKQAEQLCFETGLTGVTDAGVDRQMIQEFDSLQKSGELKIHISAMLNPTEENFETYVKNGPLRTERLHVTAIKLYADGSLGSRTALLKKPYSDDPSKIGVLSTNPDTIRKVCSLALQHGYQVNTHCIGDSAVKLVLDIYSSFLGGKNDRRWRIEHAQVVDPCDIGLFGESNIIPSVQATHATSDMYWAGERLGPVRVKYAYAYRNLMNQNGWIPNGTDFPIEKVSPLLTFYAAVARQDINGNPPGGFQTENALTRREALMSITVWAAKSDFDEDMMGTLEPGKWADFVITDRDIMTIPEKEIPATRVLKTFVHGEMVWPK
jgi:predicted amidohydrolase YtcJ